MAYIGQSIKNGTFSVLDTSGNTYNGSNTTFNLGTQVGSPAQLLVSHDGVIQKPGTDYTLATGGTQITFTTAPASGASIFIVEISGAVGGPMNRDINGDELILDVGCVMGYSTAILARLSQAVVMLETLELSEGREKIFTELGLDNVIVAKNSITEGVKEHAPYEGIFIQLAIDYFPEEFKAQLKVGGKALVVFQREGVKQCYSGFKTEAGMNWTYQFDANVAYLSEFKVDLGFEF